MKFNRRKFLHGTLAAGAVMATAKSAPLAIADEIGGSAVGDDFPWLEATIDQLQAAMAAGTLTAVALTQAYLDRIAALDQAGPKLNAVIELNPDALAQARAADQARAAGNLQGALHGIPVLVKDNLDSADRMHTTAGSLALLAGKPLQDSTVVGQLRKAGAVLLGKTNLSEWANFRSTHSISGWSGRGGQTHNPYALDRNTSGSSSGTGAAVSANLCAVGIGTETDGSIVSPASVCGIVGVKPTVGLVSRAGIIPISASQDTAGPMARTVRDAAHLLTVMASSDERDSATKQGRPQNLPTDYSVGLDGPALSGARLGLLREGFALHPRLDPLLNEAVTALRTAGAEVIEPIRIPDMGTFGDAEFEVLLYEYKVGLNAYFASLGPNAPIKSLEELIAFNRANRATELKYFEQELLEQAQAKGPLTEQAYLDARAKCLQISRTDGIDAALAEHKLDALIMVTNGPAWLIDPVNGDSYTGGSSSWAAVSGYPSITVPMGLVMGLPAGLSFTGAAWSEARLLALAADFERHTRARRLPKFLATLPV
ncbi:MAG: amidase [Cephaloticoccus sp.]|nr:amidase [Cephaloticoccus sp.]MCF7761318.1 amidase [Cephaloticoccus sp.]